MIVGGVIWKRSAIIPRKMRSSPRKILPPIDILFLFFANVVAHPPDDGRSVLRFEYDNVHENGAGLPTIHADEDDETASAGAPTTGNSIETIAP